VQICEFSFSLSGLATALRFWTSEWSCEGLVVICDSSMSGELIMSCAGGSFVV
jgi:hypothetical protein